MNTYLTTCSVTADDPRQRLHSNDMTTDVKDAGLWEAATAGDDETESLETRDADELTFAI